ncbi:MAG: beta-lactamase family protein [Chitinophagaceae bacterium]|nr:beta-lactamase family protein [Polaromonas sp.]
MEQLVSSKTIPGAVLGVAEGSNLTLIEAYGVADASTSTAMRTDSLLHIASTNKPITSFLLATLVDAGALTWDTKARDIYSGFNPASANSAANITVRQMLDMTSGLPREAGFETSEPPRKMLDGLSNVALVGAPGEKYAYSNVSISAAGFLAPLAKIKMTRALIDSDLETVYFGYNTLLQDKVLKPIGMTSSYLSVTDARATGKMAKSHSLANGVWTVSASVDTAVDNSAPSGGLKSNVTDMLRYIVTDMQGGVNPAGTRVASAANVAERQKLSVGPASANKYGLCLEIGKTDNGLALVSHTGSFDNFNSVIGWFPDKKVAFVLMTNGESTGITDLTGGGFIKRLAEIVR